MAHEDSVVASAPSVDEAIIMGLTRLMATRDEVEIEVLDEGSRGFLGVGAREARVRITRRPPEPPASEEAGPAEGSLAEKGSRSRGGEATPAKGTGMPEPGESLSMPVTETVAESRPVEARPAGAQPAEEPTAGESATSERLASEAEVLRGKVASAAEEIAHHILPGLDVKVSLTWLEDREDKEPTIWVSINGRDADSLVGPQGRSLRALQYLFRTLLYRQVDGNYNVVVDADGFYKRRRQSLEALARKKAEQAVASGRRVRLRAMPANERRIIHIALRDDPRVETESVGHGRDRAVTIIPKDDISA